jgi:hypothetical protein
MTGSEALQSVQFVTVKGKRFALMSIEDWEMLVEWIETIEDMQIAHQAYAALRAAGGDRTKAGWLNLEEVEENLK